MWRSAGNVPRSEGGRPLAHIAVNGHGSYPIAGTIPRIFFAANDQTSNQGAVWDTVRFLLSVVHRSTIPVLHTKIWHELQIADCRLQIAVLAAAST